MYNLSILDVGAAGGPKKSFPRKVSYLLSPNFFGVEPSPLKYEELVDSRSYKRVFNNAIKTDESSSSLHITSDPFVSSLLEPDIKTISKYTDSPERYVVTKLCPVEAVSLDYFIQNYLKFIPDWIKLDIQGLEANIILDSKLILDIPVVIAELSFSSLYFGQITFPLAAAHMANYNYYPLHIKYKPNMPCEVDVVFIKSIKDVTEVRSKLAICFAHLIYGNKLYAFKELSRYISTAQIIILLFKIFLISFLRLPTNIFRFRSVFKSLWT